MKELKVMQFFLRYSLNCWFSSHEDLRLTLYLSKMTSGLKALFSPKLAALTQSAVFRIAKRHQKIGEIY